MNDNLTYKKEINIESINKIVTIKTQTEHDETLRGHTSYPWCLKIITNNILISGSYDKTIKIWNIDSGLCINTLEGHLGSIYCLEVA